ncbi:hypothetical protein MTR67_039927 [Solanum verrucosum]|uniref:Ribosomal protein S19 n=1 Tax=Solanum verrucosum TaxID=315347 RepID=A0AAF0UIA8_SOLVR|nr:hypothetical protein MTR67_039927 [Solanum verrucosum]
MPRRSIWKGSFVDAFLLRMKKKRDLLFNRKIWSRRSSISPEFVDCSVRIYNGKTPVRCKITEGKHTGRACFDRVSGAQLNVDIMNARCRIPGRETRATIPYVPIASASRAPAPSSAGEA